MQAHMHQVLSFQVGEVECAVALPLIYEVIRCTEVTRFPSCEGAMVGAIHRGGQFLPALDLRPQFGYPVHPPNERSRLLILDGAGHQVALLVDALGEICQLSAQAIQPPPAWVPASTASYLHGLGTVAGRWLLILDPSQLLPDEISSGVAPIRSPTSLSSEDDRRDEQETPHPRRLQRPKVPWQPLDVEEAEVQLQSGLDAQSLKELEEMARAMSEGDFYRQMSSKIQGELKNLAMYMEKTMANLQLLNPCVKISIEHDIPTASQQLTDVVKTTEEATNTIISLTETLLDHEAVLGEALEKLRATKNRRRDDQQLLDELVRLHQEDEKTLIEILTNLSFQDLTGQRINKIMHMVNIVQGKLVDLVKAFGIQVEGNEAVAPPQAPVPKALGGPEELEKLPQDSVDSLLNQEVAPEDGTPAGEAASGQSSSPQPRQEEADKLAQNSVDDLLNELFR